MSGIAGLFNLDGKPAELDDLQKMVTSMLRRGPDDQGIFVDGPVGLGHAMLHTTPEALHEKQPLINARGDLVIVADLRLDNRQELIDILRLGDRDPLHLGDAELVLHAYDKWGEVCPTKFLGDFAFVIWDRRQHRLFCARDHFGVKPFYYYHAPGRFFAFASEARSILLLTQVPYRINEQRVADFLASFEGIDKISTFFEDVYRLSPAYTLMIGGTVKQSQRYWTLEPGTELHLPSDTAYVDAFLEVFTEVVRCRLRGANPVGSMLSGGMDSGSIVAVASQLLVKDRRGPLITFSVVADNQENCVETNAIYSALTMEGLESHIVRIGHIDEFLPKLQELTWVIDEPFDYRMSLLRAIYLSAHQHGTNVLLDGVDGGLVFTEGEYLPRLLRHGRWLDAYQEAVGQEQFWGGAYPAWRELFYGVRRAFIPDFLRKLYHKARPDLRRRGIEAKIRNSLMSKQFVHRIGFVERVQQASMDRHQGLLSNSQQEIAKLIEHSSITVGIERYNRVASHIGVEPRHPFMDRRLVAFSLTLPETQKMVQGWPKTILRRAMVGRLPHSVRLRRGKQHLGWDFTNALTRTMESRVEFEINANKDTLAMYIDPSKHTEAYRAYLDEGDPDKVEMFYDIAYLASWLRRFECRPKVSVRTPTSLLAAA